LKLVLHISTAIQGHIDFGNTAMASSVIANADAQARGLRRP
jgi:hypothetical protein